MKVAVVGHVEWIRFARVDVVPPPGTIAHSTEHWEQAGGGGAVAAIQLALLAGECHLFTALGVDAIASSARGELESRGVRVHDVPRPGPTRWAFTHVDAVGERTITTVGDKLRALGSDADLPWHELGDFDAVVFTAGDEDALRRARKARVLVAAARELETLRRAGVQLDALVGSARDDGERYQHGDLDPEPALVVSTSGALGGWAQPGGPFSAAPVPGPVEDAYGCGDSFMAGLAFALASDLDTHEAIEFAARCGAAALTGRGVSPQAVSLTDRT